MTDKQIIIDCVDVSEWTDGEVYYKLEHYSPKATKQIAFDLYKQLKAKEQECERLRFPMQDTNYAILTKEEFEQLDRLKAENDKYSLFIEKLCDYAGLECDDEEQAMRTLSDLASQMNKARWIIDRYKQTLTEIKEIAENFYNTGFFRADNDCILINNNACVETLEKILQKISEVEDGV